MGWFTRNKETEPKEEGKEESVQDKYFSVLNEVFGVDVANKMINEDAWIGMTKEQLQLMYGDPKEVKKKVSKTKEQEVIIHRSKNQSTRRWTNNSFTFENDELVSYDVKSSIRKVWTIRGFSFSAK